MPSRHLNLEFNFRIMFCENRFCVSSLSLRDEHKNFSRKQIDILDFTIALIRFRVLRELQKSPISCVMSSVRPCVSLST